jgi:hypothetical protein
VILDDETGAVYLGINHGGTYTSRWGNIYVSDATGVQYVSSVQHVAFGALDMEFDFDRISGVEGVYIANILENYNDRNVNTAKITTLITMDNGNTWNPIQRPIKDINGNPYDCTGVCSFFFIPHELIHFPLFSHAIFKFTVGIATTIPSVQSTVLTKLLA